MLCAFWLTNYETLSTPDVLSYLLCWGFRVRVLRPHRQSFLKVMRSNFSLR